MDEPSERDTSLGWRSAIADALRGKEHDYTQGSLNRAITLLAIPMVLEFAMESVFAICDVYFVGRLGSGFLTQMYARFRPRQVGHRSGKTLRMCPCRYAAVQSSVAQPTAACAGPALGGGACSAAA